MVQVAHFFTTLSFLLVASSTAVNAAVIHRRDDVCPSSEICGSYDPAYISNVLTSTPPSSPNPPTKRITNAERFARGLPPLKPMRRFEPCRFLFSLHCVIFFEEKLRDVPAYSH